MLSFYYFTASNKSPRWRGVFTLLISLTWKSFSISGRVGYTEHFCFKSRIRIIRLGVMDNSERNIRSSTPLSMLHPVKTWAYCTMLNSDSKNWRKHILGKVSKTVQNYSLCYMHYLWKLIFRQQWLPNSWSRYPNWKIVFRQCSWNISLHINYSCYPDMK